MKDEGRQMTGIPGRRQPEEKYFELINYTQLVFKCSTDEDSISKQSQKNNTSKRKAPVETGAIKLTAYEKIDCLENTKGKKVRIQ